MENTQESEVTEITEGLFLVKVPQTAFGKEARYIAELQYKQSIIDALQSLVSLPAPTPEAVEEMPCGCSKGNDHFKSGFWLGILFAAIAFLIILSNFQTSKQPS